MEMFFHVGHILEGVVFLDVPPLFLALEEMFKELVPHSNPVHLLEGGKIVLILGLQDMLKVLPPSGVPIMNNIL